MLIEGNPMLSASPGKSTSTAISGLTRRQALTPPSDKGIPAKFYTDGNDAKLVSQDFNGYRGQFTEDPELKCRFEFKRCAGVGHKQEGIDKETTDAIDALKTVEKQAIKDGEDAQNKLLKDGDDAGTKALKDANQKTKDKFTQALTTSFVYNPEKYLVGAALLGSPDLYDDNAGRQTTTTYVANMPFCKILAPHQKQIDDLCALRIKKGNLGLFGQARSGTLPPVVVGSPVVV